MGAIRSTPSSAPARWAAAITLIIALGTLIGWAFNLPRLTSILTGYAEMKANAAVALMLCGIAQLLLADHLGPLLERLGQLLALLAAAIGLASFAEYLFGWQLGMDQWLFADHRYAYNVFPGRMSPYSAVALIALGSALAAKPIGSLDRLSRAGGYVASLIGAVAWVGYLWDARELVTDRWLPPVAINTATCFVLLGAGILLTPGPETRRIHGQLDAVAATEIKILAGFLFAIALLLFGGGYSYRTSVQFADSVAWVARTQQVRAAAANVHGLLAGAELALRNYWVSGDPAQGDEYRQLVGQVDGQVAELARLTNDDPLQRKNLAALESVVAVRIDSMASVAAAYRQYGLPAARAVTHVLERSNSTHDVKIATERMDTLEVRRLAEREASIEHARQHMLISMMATLAVASGLFFALFRRIHREMRGRREVQDSLAASDQYNRSILASSPDCKAILNLDGRIHRMTPRGLELLEIPDAASVENTEWLALWNPQDRSAAERAIAAAREGTAGRFHGYCPTRSGIAKCWDVIVMPIRGADGRVERLLTTARDVTERNLAEQEIRELNQELQLNAARLQATNEHLESFGYSVSHDLRAPLLAIDGFAQMLEEDYADRLDTEGRRYVAVIRESSQKMGLLIDNLLMFSKAGLKPEASRAVDVESMVREVIEEIRDSTAVPGIEIGRLPATTGDPGLLRQVWLNLVTNAIKYSSKRPTPAIQILGACVGAENHYSVRDNGVGFDMAQANKLFSVFQRLHRADEFKGTGIGLAIVHRIVTAHGGRVWAEGKVNEGAVFSFALPAA